jgi:hypothetical protein
VKVFFVIFVLKMEHDKGLDMIVRGGVYIYRTLFVMH